MPDKDKSPISAVNMTPAQRALAQTVFAAGLDYAWANGWTDVLIQGHEDQQYVGAYASSWPCRGAGKYIFGFARRHEVVHFAFPIGVSEPYRLAKSWTGDPTRCRAIIELDENPSQEDVLYLSEMARRSLVHVYLVRTRWRNRAAARTSITSASRTVQG
jgi:hypothetical protein